MSRRDVIKFGIGEDRKPVQFLIHDLREIHFSVSGATGQRKTLFVISQLQQYIAAGDGVVFVDLGSDIAAYWLLRRAAEKAGKNFYFFSVDRTLDSLYFDPIVSFADPIVASGAIGSGLNLTHAPGYGRSFWGRLNAADINAAFDNLAARGVSMPCFTDFCTELARLAKTRGRGREASEPMLAADQLNRLEHFGLAPNPEQQLRLHQAIQEQAVVVFHCPSAQFGDAAKATATLAAWCTMIEQENVIKANPNDQPPNTHLVIDEYAQVAAGRSSLESQLTLVRKWGLQIWLIFQNREQMQTPDGDLYPTIRSNCQNFIFTAETEEERQDLMNASLDEWKKHKPGSSRTNNSRSEQERWFLAPRLDRNKVIEVCAKAMWLFGIIKLGDKHRDPIPFQLIPPTTSVLEHQRLKAKQYPTKTNSTTPQMPVDLPPELLERHKALDAVIAERRIVEWYKPPTN